MRMLNKKVTISYYVEGARNDLGEPSRTLTVRATDVPCRKDPRSPKIRFEFPGINRNLMVQGVNYIPTMLLMVKASQDIENGDTITDSDGNTYLVARVETIGRSHKEAILATKA